MQVTPHSKLVISTHAVFLANKDIYGPPHIISHYLNMKKIAHTFVKHPLKYASFSLLEDYDEGKTKLKEKTMHLLKIPLIGRYLNEFIITSSVINRMGKKDIFIGVDPMNVLYAFLTFTKKTNIIYFSVDYSTARFNNFALSWAYTLLDRFASAVSNETWSVSERIVEMRKQFGLKDEKNRILPNAAFFDEIDRLSIDQIEKNNLVILSVIENVSLFKIIIDAIKIVKEKIPDVKLVFIGEGVGEKELKEYILEKKLEKNVKFYGILDHERIFEVLTKCSVGLALYPFQDKAHFHYFSDPMKVRDYLAAGLPVIISGSAQFLEELISMKAGLRSKIDRKDLSEKIIQILSIRNYSKMRSNAISLAEKYDAFKILSGLLPIK